MTPRLIRKPVTIEAAGTPTKIISEYIGRVASGNADVSIAVMNSPQGWSEPGQTPEFDEYTLVLEGELTVESPVSRITVTSGQSLHSTAGEWIRYSSPAPSGAKYVSVCIPAFSPDTVHRDS